ncbi:unnamed protein product [Closterium sp. NIES-64]|nr:unnamed protein product [Closterium sp. NIES-64]
MKGGAFLLLLHACLLLASHRLAAANSRRELQASCPAGVVCPTGATCAVDGSGYPFCKCAAGQAIINGVCAPAASWAEVGTNVVIYNKAKYANTPTSLAPAVLRGAAPNSSACVNLPAAFNGTIGSVRIMWNVNDGVADHLVCGKLFFWDKPNCCCSGSGYQIPGGWTTVDPNKFTYTTTSVSATSGIIATARSISCQAAIATPTYPCAVTTCPVNATCSVVNSAAVCTCNAGLTMVNGQCVVPNPCTGYTCPANSACSNVNGVATCTCNTGYQMVNGQCVGEFNSILLILPVPIPPFPHPSFFVPIHLFHFLQLLISTLSLSLFPVLLSSPPISRLPPAKSLLYPLLSHLPNASAQPVHGLQLSRQLSMLQRQWRCHVHVQQWLPDGQRPVRGAAVSAAGDVPCCTFNGASTKLPDPCATANCPLNSVCSNVNGVATCTCSAGFQMVNGQCAGMLPCSLLRLLLPSAPLLVLFPALANFLPSLPLFSAFPPSFAAPSSRPPPLFPLPDALPFLSPSPFPCTPLFSPPSPASSASPPGPVCEHHVSGQRQLHRGQRRRHLHYLCCSAPPSLISASALVAALSPAAALLPAPDPCAGFSCPANSACSNVNGVATCTCSAGYQMTDGQCVVPARELLSFSLPAPMPARELLSFSLPAPMPARELLSFSLPAPMPARACTYSPSRSPRPCLHVPARELLSFSLPAPMPAPIADPCASTTCPAKATCSSVNGVATCVCAVGYTMVSGACQPAAPCSLVTCPANCTCSSANGVAKCNCADLCYGVRCPDVSKCTYMLGAPVCTCPPPYTRLIDNKCSNATLAFSNYLDNHNAARAAVGAIPLVWNATLATRAQAWATALTNSTYNCGLSHGGNSGEGQNLSGASPSGWASDAAAVSWWVGEGDLYSYAVFSGGCSTGNWADCGHYTQVIWNNTRTVGCAKASCGTSADVWACHYYPPGNYGGQLPYVQDPCYRVACPSTATCTVRYGQPMCECGAGQVLVNNATCQPDPCASGTTTCPGNLVCDGSSGSAQCACPTGLVPITSDTCVPPACVGAVCPAQATCAVDGSGYPFCQCPTGWYLGSNVCVQGTPAAVSATSLAIYNTASYTSTAPALGPTLVRTGLPANSSRASCVDIPGGIAAASLRVLWNVPDSTGAPKQSCGLLWFWTSASCYGSATGYYRPAGDVTNFAWSIALPSRSHPSLSAVLFPLSLTLIALCCVVSPLAHTHRSLLCCFPSRSHSSLSAVLFPLSLTLIALCCAVSPLCACSTTSGNVALVKAVACAI